MTNQQLLLEELQKVLGNFNDGVWSSGATITELENVFHKLIIEIEKEDLQFDDIVKDENGTYTQVCNDCTNKFEFDNSKLDFNSAIGVCGVEGCENEALHYLALT